jgi:alkanesulfonate monooxygenase SsuD/methylene tetrahydromethanopterin reductase-like flavin-dependent oxidoreductase (luciferase family)
VGGTEAEAIRRRDELVEAIPIDGALCRLSGSLGVDFAGFDLDQPIDEMPTNTSRGLMAAMTQLDAGRRWTLRETAQKWALSLGMPQVMGTPEQVASQLEHLWRESGCYSFNITPTTTPKSIEDIVDHVIPLLQRRGVFRREYEGKTFRENLMGKVLAAR